jgi:hypothetical protein
MELASSIVIFLFLGVIVWGFIYGFNDGTEE